MLALSHTRAVSPRIIPDVCHDFRSRGGLRMSAACFYGGYNWSLSPLQRPEDAKHHLALCASLYDALRGLGVNRAYAPRTLNFNAKVGHPAEISKMFVLGPGLLMFRDAAQPMDGTTLRFEEDALIYTAGGCALTVATLKKLAVGAHTGQRSVIDSGRIRGEKPRAHESVVDAIVDTFLHSGFRKEDLCDMEVRVFFSIRPEHLFHPYDHLEHGMFNRMLVLDLERRSLRSGVRRTPKGIEISVPEIVRGQFLAHGVPEENIHLEDAYLPASLPTTRTGDGTGRYLVAVVRHN